MFAWDHPLLSTPPSEQYWELTNWSHPTRRHKLGFLGELELKEQVPKRFLLESNPLDNIGDWMRHVGKGVDFVFKASSYTIAVERKVISAYVSRDMIQRHWIPRFRTDRNGKFLRKADFKIVVLNKEAHLSIRIREELYNEHNIRVMDVEEFLGFLNFLESTERIPYSYFGYPKKGDNASYITAFSPELDSLLSLCRNCSVIFDVKPLEIVNCVLYSYSGRG